MKSQNKNTMLLLNLDDSIINEVAEVMASKTCRAILKSLSDGQKTETELSEELYLPLSTVHYNLQKLIRSHLIEAGSFHYSKKGKEINHYQISKKYVIISPRSREKMSNSFKRLLTSVILGLLVLKPINNFLNSINRNYVSLTKTSSIFKGAVQTGTARNISQSALTTAAHNTNQLGNVSNASGSVTPELAKGVSQNTLLSSIINNTYAQIVLFLIITLLIYLIIGFILKRQRIKE